MELLGYEVLGEFGIPGRRYFRRDDSAGTRTHQIHAFKAGTPDVTRHLAFRDYMIAHTTKAQAYSELKQKLAREHAGDLESYIAGKDSFVKEHEALALAWRNHEHPGRVTGRAGQQLGATTFDIVWHQSSEQ